MEETYECMEFDNCLCLQTVLVSKFSLQLLFMDNWFLIPLKLQLSTWCQSPPPVSKMTTSTKEQDSSARNFHHDVTVIGVGWSGLVTIKWMLEAGLSVVGLERRDNLGGVWYYSDDATVTSVMESTRTTSSSTVTEISDYPMPEDIGMFPHNKDVLKYLQGFAESFNLMPNIRCSIQIEKAEKEGETWIVRCANGDVYTSRFLIIATGVHQHPNRELEKTMLKGFTGKIYHAREIKKLIPEHKDQRLLVLGGGETGSDIVMEWFSHSKFIYWSIPRGQHFFRKYAKVVPWGKPQALDKASSRAMKTVAPFHKSKPGLSWVCKWTTAGSLLAYQGHGIPEWRNNSKFFHCFINKNGKVLDLIDYKRLVPKGGIVECKGKEITFVDGTKQEFDLVIMSTGYKVDYPFLPKRYADVGIRQRHKFVFDVQDPSIAFVGLVRPIVGSIVGISELQARWVAKVFSKRITLTPLKEREKDVQRDSEHWNEYFKNSSQRIEGLVEGFTYIDDIARHAGVSPNYWELLKRNPWHWYIAIFAPYNAATFRLNELKYEDQAIATMQSHRQTTLGPVHLLLILFLRTIWFDWWLDNLGFIKYHIQISSWWHVVRSWRVMRAANWVWCLPKRMLFDNRSDD